MNATISKGDLFDLMGVEAFSFALWLVNQGPNQMATKIIFDSLTEINLASPLVSLTMNNLFLEGVISQVTVDAINAKKNQLLGV